MMSECVSDYFILNDIRYPVAAFEQLYHPGDTYLYEVFRVQQKIPLFIEEHMDRFSESAQISGLSVPVKREHLLMLIHMLIESNQAESGNIKIVLNKTASGEHQLFVYYVEHSYPTREQLTNGVPVKLFFGERKNPNAKVMDIILRTGANDLIKQAQVNEVLLVNHDGYITEGSRSNVFFIRDNRIITTPLDKVLGGVTRKNILEICRDNKIEIEEEYIHYKELDKVEAAFLSGTSRRILPVNSIDDLPLKTNHPLLKQLMILFDERVAGYIESKSKA
ncbi:MAG: aminotransferase class IV [Lentimicrobiaceae bacterium]